MELTFDPNRWHPAPRHSSPGDAPGSTRPEWLVLAARLAAAHAFQRHALRAEQTGVLARSSMDTRAHAGSFQPETARVLAGFATASGTRQGDESSLASGEGRMLANVNPTSSGDLKDTTGMVSTLAGPIPSGNRGLK